MSHPVYQYRVNRFVSLIFETVCTVFNSSKCMKTICGNQKLIIYCCGMLITCVTAVKTLFISLKSYRDGQSKSM